MGSCGRPKLNEGIEVQMMRDVNLEYWQWKDASKMG